MHFDPQDRHIELMKRAPRSMTWQDGENFEHWQEKARAKLAQLLGLPLEMPECDQFHIEYVQDTPAYRDIRFTFSSEPTVDVCCHLMTPLSYEGRLPMIICLQGHSKGMHISMGIPNNIQDFYIVSNRRNGFAGTNPFSLGVGVSIHNILNFDNMRKGCAGKSTHAYGLCIHL